MIFEDTAATSNARSVWIRACMSIRMNTVYQIQQLPWEGGLLLQVGLLSVSCRLNSVFKESSGLWCRWRMNNQLAIIAALLHLCVMFVRVMLRGHKASYSHWSSTHEPWIVAVRCTRWDMKQDPNQSMFTSSVLFMLILAKHDHADHLEFWLTVMWLMQVWHIVHSIA